MIFYCLNFFALIKNLFKTSYVPMLPGGYEMLLHILFSVVLGRLIISDIPVLIC